MAERGEKRESDETERNPDKQQSRNQIWSKLCSLCCGLLAISMLVWKKVKKTVCWKISTEADTVQMLCRKLKPVNWIVDRDITAILFDLRLECLSQFRGKTWNTVLPPPSISLKFTLWYRHFSWCIPTGRRQWDGNPGAWVTGYSLCPTANLGIVNTNQ